MKKLVCVLCAVALIALFPGCQTESKECLLLPPENPGSSLVSYDPDRQVYFNGKSIFVDYYVGLVGVPYFSMPLYSKTYIDPVDISVSFPVEAPIGVEVTQVKGIEGKTEFTAAENDLPENVLRYYVYAAYRGGNLAALADAKITNKMNIGVSDPLRAEYEALQTEDLPDVYVYNICIDLSQVPEPEQGKPWTLEKVCVSVNGETYETGLGRVRIYNRNDLEPLKLADAVPVQGGVYTVNIDDRYGDGIVKLPRICIFDGNEGYDYTTVIAAWMLDENCEVLSELLTIEDVFGESRTINGFSEWLCFQKGEKAYLELTVKNKNADRFLGSTQYHFVIETYDANDYESYEEALPGVDRCKVYTFVCETNTNHYENYAIIFDVVDMEPYYDCYFDNYEPWRKDYLN